jgi:hypothetical protein
MEHKMERRDFNITLVVVGFLTGRGLANHSLFDIGGILWISLGFGIFMYLLHKEKSIKELI